MKGLILLFTVLISLNCLAVRDTTIEYCADPNNDERTIETDCEESNARFEDCLENIKPLKIEDVYEYHYNNCEMDHL